MSTRQSKLDALKEQYKKAVIRFDEVLQQPKNDFIRDSAIQRFEFTYELAWKVMKAYLQEKGAQDIRFPKDVIRSAFQAGLVPDDPTWLKMVDTRNKTSHLYKEAMAEQVYLELKNYLPLFKSLAEKL